MWHFWLLLNGEYFNCISDSSTRSLYIPLQRDTEIEDETAKEFYQTSFSPAACHSLNRGHVVSSSGLSPALHSDLQKNNKNLIFALLFLIYYFFLMFSTISHLPISLNSIWSVLFSQTIFLNLSLWSKSLANFEDILTQNISQTRQSLSSLKQCLNLKKKIVKIRIKILFPRLRFYDQQSIQVSHASASWRFWGTSKPWAQAQPLSHDTSKMMLSSGPKPT